MVGTIGSKVMDLREARRRLLDIVCARSIEWVPLHQALGRVLGCTLSAPWALPKEARSRVDGYAIRSHDTLSATREKPVRLTLKKDIIFAGHIASLGIAVGEAARIMTGAPLPEGADAVVPQEETESLNDSILVFQVIAPGSWVNVCGEDVRKGEIFLAKGDILNPTALAMVASFGYTVVPVYRRPGVALLSTGDELLELGECREGPVSYCTTRHLLEWLVAQQKGQPVVLGIARDEAGEIVRRLKDCEADLIITTGGTGRGEKDLVLKAWQELGVRCICHGINLVPGRNSALGIRDSTLFCALPGNPWAAQVVFQELIVPCLMAMQGLGNRGVSQLVAVIGERILKRKGIFKAVPGILDFSSTPPIFTPLYKSGFSLFELLRRRNGYVMVESDREEVNKGEQVIVQLCDLPLEASHVFLEPRNSLDRFNLAKLVE